ncbi:hypothetical protein Nepgr_033269 [Nepenthes gracilis]|uniref:Uncharacterized protein n=1 Tax=Nepenthes gracilis TaxID=150966 RepID=A0AAD3Y8W4_NEPGR|nr:hypothetical protein Nepgr_033269 [Nepenthes gracilis]
MEDEKAAAYYDELTRKGGGAARFKQGLGFSTTMTTAYDEPPSRGSALPSSSSSFLGNFVKASNATKLNDLQKQAQLQSIQTKLKKKEPTSIETLSATERERDKDSDGDRNSRRRSRGRDRERETHSRSSRNRNRTGEREMYRERRRGSRSRSLSGEEAGRSGGLYRTRSIERESDKERRGRRRRSNSRSFCVEEKHGRERGRDRNRSLSPRGWKSEKGKGDGGRRGKMGKKERDGAFYYARLIEGYDKMTSAERVKAKMKLQLTETAQKDATIGSGSGWERFEFDKDASLDDEEIEAADDDVALVKHIGQSFRFSNVKAKWEEEIKAAHDQAMFGAPAIRLSLAPESEHQSKEEKREIDDDDPSTCLISDKVLAKQQGSWRDRARRS